MKTLFRTFITPIFIITVMLCGVPSCSDDDNINEPIAPILKGVKLPGINDVMPGGAVKIEGVGFDPSDKLILTQGAEKIETEVLEVTYTYIKFLLPITAGGEYNIIIERTGKQTTLLGLLKAPFIVPVTDIVLPDSNVNPKAEVIIKGKGFEPNDEVTFTAAFYPQEANYTVPVNIVDEGIKVILPEGIYGINNLIIVRKSENRQSTLGTITIETQVGDIIGGGVVYWVDSKKEHGLICSMNTIGTIAEKWGPEVAPSNASGTGKAIGSGAQNTQKIAAKIKSLMAEHGWVEWIGVKIAAELCEEYTFNQGGLNYNDWFLPSQDELIELFKTKSVVSSQGVTIIPNNYWSSTEGDGDSSGWAAYYVNFYEESKLISELASKSGWALGVFPVRAY